MVERVIPVAAREDITTFRNLFFSKAHKSFSDSHLWLSVFIRPSRSNFTRVQRISCILSLVLLTMLSNALFYKADVENVDTVHGFTVGPFSFTLQSLFISFISCLIVLPANIAIDQLFRKSRSRHNEVSSIWPKSPWPEPSAPPLDNPQFDTQNNLTEPVNDYAYKDRQQLPTQAVSPNAGYRQELSRSSLVSVMQMGFNKETSQGKSTNCDMRISTSLTFTSDAFRNSPNFENSTSSLRSPSRSDNGCSYSSGNLPHWCIYIGWFLVFVSSAASAFFTFSFSMQWGREKSNAWLTAMVLSIGESVTIIQPTKVSYERFNNFSARRIRSTSCFTKSEINVMLRNDFPYQPTGYRKHLVGVIDRSWIKVQIHNR